MHKEPLKCYYCDKQIGWHITHEWGPNGQDPPEYEIFEEHEGCESAYGEPLCEDCYDLELNDDEEELEEDEDSE